MIESYALQFLKKGREDWDVPHTRAVVFYAERLAKAADLDVLVLVTTAWLHDVGYFGLFGDGDSSQLTQVEQIVHLVSVHDNLKELQTLEEFVFMEADTLGAIDLARVVPTFAEI
ncbi:MAG: HD domain-containing protein [Patescibacteria group bacterium]